MKEEIWKAVPGYENKYWVSNMGQIKSLNFKGSKKEHMLSPFKGRNGYALVELCGIAKTVHSIVWTTFNGPVPEGQQINHINEIKTDNRLENLNLMTRKENCNWGTRNERIAKSHSKILLQYDLEGSLIKEWDKTTKEICKENNWSSGAISEVCTGKRRSAYGFKWAYKNN